MKQDLRIRRSETSIENAFLELVEEKGYENVKLVEIAEKANVNRNTIYLRYGAKEDIIETILNKSFNAHLEKLNTAPFYKARSSKRGLEAMFTSIFEVLEEEVEIYRIVLTDPNLVGYADKMIDKIRTMMLSAVKDTKSNKLAVEYMLKGVYGVFRMWIIYDTGTIEENVKILSSLVAGTARQLSFK